MREAGRQIERPIFFIGMPRSGTTISFAAFAVHRELAWFSQYMERFPAFPGMALLTRLVDLVPSARKAVMRHGEPRSLRARMQITFHEAYEVWRRCCGDEFLDSYLLHSDAPSSAARCVRRRVDTTMLLQGKPRFAAKLTGPARIQYLDSIFAEPAFVHVIRDPRAVVDSLLRVPFWRDTERLTSPAWKGGLTEEEIEAWRRDGSPEALAAVQWKAVLRTARAEAARHLGDRYVEVRYEDFVADPHATIGRLQVFAGLPADRRVDEFIDQRLNVRNPSADRQGHSSPKQIRTIETLLAEPMAELGYA